MKMNTHWDLIIVGGGFTGVSAAIAAARHGMRVLLADQAGFLGGAACNCLVNPFMDYKTERDGNMLQLCRGIFEEICEGMHNLGGMKDPMFHEEALKLVLDRMTISAGVEVLLHVTLCSAKTQNEKITSVCFVGKSGIMSFSARYFIDATGDADLAFLAGCPTQLGREEDNLCQPMTLCFRIANIDMDEYKASRAGINKLYQQFQKEGKIQNPRENVLIFGNLVKNTLHFNTTRIVKHDPTNPFDLTRAEMQAREQMYEMYCFLKDNICGFENSDLSFSAPQIGVRESRKIIGHHVLTGEELLTYTKFEDAIAAGNYDIDIHNPEGTGTIIRSIPKGEYYTIPYRSLQPIGINNLLVAGRCLSANHEAQASVRIMPICACMGEAAGIAVSVAAAENVSVKHADVCLIQKKLKEDGAFIGV